MYAWQFAQALAVAERSAMGGGTIRRTRPPPDRDKRHERRRAACDAGRGTGRCAAPRLSDPFAATAGERDATGGYRADDFAEIHAEGIVNLVSSPHGLSLDPGPVAAIAHFKDFLLTWGFLETDFDVDALVDRRPIGGRPVAADGCQPV
jgi:hypothetical protein